MPEQPTEDTQKTQPKKGEPIDIPIPSESQVERDFLKVALAKHDDDQDDGGPDGT